MARKRYKAEEILGKLRQAEVLIGQGQSVAEVCREIGVTEVTYFRWRKEYGGLKLDQARKLKGLEKEKPSEPSTSTPSAPPLSQLSLFPKGGAISVTLS